MYGTAIVKNRLVLPSRPWRSHPRETLAFAMLGACGAAALAGAAWSTPSPVSGDRMVAARAALPQPPSPAIRPLAPTDAQSVNAAIPLSAGLNPAARPFRAGALSSADLARATDCLASAVYYEAGQEGEAGQRAVAQVVLNRVRHPAFPASVCGVVYQGSTRPTGCQFTFTCDGSLARRPDPAGWARARRVAAQALAGSVHDAVGNATHYHADYVVPYWAASLAKNAVVGTHIFYRWAGAWGRPQAFAQAYARREPDSGSLRLAALAAERAQPVAEAVADVPGAEPIAESKLGPGGRRIGVRFQLAAREAVEEAVRQPRPEIAESQTVIRRSLVSAEVDSGQRAFGSAAPAAPVSGGSPGASPQ